MNKQISIIDECFHESNQNDYHLALQIDNDVISYSVMAIDTNQIILVESFNFQHSIEKKLNLELIFKFLNETKILQLDYQKITITYSVSTSTIIPSSLYDESNKEDYLRLLDLLDTEDNFLSDYIKSLDAYNCYAISLKLKEGFKSKYPKANIKHSNSSLLEIILLQYKNFEIETVIVNVHSTYFEVFALKGKNLLLFNTFDFKTKEDFLYYLLFVYDQLHLNPETNELLILGEIAENSQLHAFIYKYIRFVKFAKRSDSLKYSYLFNKIPEHYYFNLLNLYLCE